jgi:hypothetical protein
VATITIEVPDEISRLIAGAGDRLPELLLQSLQQHTLPAHVYRYVLDFLARNPSIEEVRSFGPTPEMTDRLRTLLDREVNGDISISERAELDEYQRLEHLIIMIKSGSLRFRPDAS